VADVSGSTRGRLMLNVTRHSDIAMAVAVVGILITLVIPLPTMLLDVLLTVNIAFSLTVLMLVLSAKTPLEFSTFPSLLLCATLFRLSLNVASTRLILLEGDAGEVIHAFGNFVVGGNLVVGLVVFLILVIIQFVVITKGSGRISEVAARFTLDAMPGKQMAIDADLNAGLITEEVARDRRKMIGNETEFYGAMDGSSKFVRGDAIAGIIITLVNIFGGMIVGLLGKMSISEAIRTYSILTVGDGLVTQIPSLIIATAAGILITKTSSDSSLGHDLAGQLLSRPKSLLIASGILMFFGMIPGLPKVPFFILSVVCASIYFLSRSSAAEKGAEEKTGKTEKETEKKRLPEPAKEVKVPRVDRISVEVGYQLVPLVDPSKTGGLLDRISGLRRQFARKLGFVVPPIRFKDNVQLDSNTYSIRIKGEEVARGELMTGHLLAIDSGAASGALPGIDTTEPAFGLPAKWIEEQQRHTAELSGFTVIDPASVLITHVSETLKTHSHEIISREDVQGLVEDLKQTAPTVVNELIPNIMTLGAVQKVLRALLKEGIPICDLGTVLESLSDHASTCKDTAVLAEFVRQTLSRTICSQHVDQDGVLQTVSLDPSLEQEIARTVQTSDQGGGVAMEPHLAQQFFEELPKVLQKAMAAGSDVVLLTSAAIRRHVKTLTTRVLPGLAVVSYNEIAPGVEVETCGVLSLPVGAET